MGFAILAPVFVNRHAHRPFKFVRFKVPAVDIRSKITDEPISEIAAAIENKIDDWQTELTKDIIED